MTTFREVRLFHWRQLMAVRQMQKQITRDTPSSSIKSKLYNDLEAIASRHLGAVQYLNDFVPGTAEQDHDASIQGLPVRSSSTDAALPTGAGGHFARILAGELAQYAAELERKLPSPGETFTAGPEGLRILQERSERCKLVRELSSILFRAGELACGSSSSSG